MRLPDGTPEAWLSLMGHHLRITADTDEVVADVVGRLSPPCDLGGPKNVAWTVQVRNGSAAPADLDALRDRPQLIIQRDGPRLVLSDVTGTGTAAVGQYAPGSSPVWIESDLERRTTRVVLPDRSDPGNRWVDWLARVFFGSRLIADGWRLVHASAVCIADRAVLIAAPPHGGKSTLAFRACAELRAALMADDLVFLGGAKDAPLAVGWPTRIAVPTECLKVDLVPIGFPLHAVLRTRHSGRERERIVLNPVEHRNLMGMEHTGPKPLGALITIRSGARTGDGGQRSSGQSAADAFQSAGMPVAQRLFITDMLGLVGGHQLLTVAMESIDDWWPDHVPVVPLDVEDLTELPTLPVWPQLLAQFPWRTEVQR